MGTGRRLLHLAWGLAVLACALAPPAAAQGTAAQTRYSLAHGCYSLTGADGRPIANADQLRMQPTALGRYLLYRPDRTFLAAQGDGDVAPAGDASPAADWRVEEAGDG